MSERKTIVFESNKKVCDFCGCSDPVYNLEAEDHVGFDTRDTMPELERSVEVASDGDWCACEACADLAENQRVEELIERCVASDSFRNRLMWDMVPLDTKRVVILHMRKMWGEMFIHMNGKKTRIRPDETKDSTIVK